MTCCMKCEGIDSDIRGVKSNCNNPECDCHKSQAMNQLECWENEKHIENCPHCFRRDLVRRLFVANVEQRVLDTQRAGQPPYAPITMDDCIKELGL